MEETLQNTTNSGEYVMPLPSTTWSPDALNAAARRAAEADVQAIQEAIQDNPDKEPFDYQKFVQLYWRKDPQGDVSLNDSPTVQAEYRRRYYLDFRNAQTIADFACRLEDLDARAGN